MLVDGASMQLPHKDGRIGDTLRDELDDGAVAFGVRCRDVVADADVTALDALVQFDKVTADGGVEVEDTAVILPQTLYLLVRNKTRCNQIVEQASGYPLGILHIALFARELFDEIRIDKVQFDTRFKYAPYRHPVDARTLHGTLFHAF